MTREQAKTEIMQIYGSLSEEKKMALDVLMAQNCDQCEVGNPCLDCEYEFKSQAEVNAHAIQSALDNGTNTVIGTAQADNIPVMYYPQVDGITPTVVAQADGEYISKEKAIIQLSWDLSEAELPRIKESLDKLPSVDIPPEHDGCKDCKYETYPDYYYPCCDCKQNYKDEWQKKPHWIMKHRTINEVKYHTGLDDMGEEHTIKELIR